MAIKDGEMDDTKTEENLVMLERDSLLIMEVRTYTKNLKR
jgi:hypothetical protein